jgi:diadenylate cyclase
MDIINNILNFSWNFRQTITFWDVLDITIIAFIIYKLLTFVRKTNSAKVIKGILLLLAVMILSNIMHLSVVSYLLGGTFEMGLLALIVLFQPELRRILEQFGSGSMRDIFGHPVKSKSMETAITQIVLACTDMSKSRTGALLVFERKINLDSYIKTGTIVDASPAAELVKNLFYDKAPLHDGAVILRDGRIAGAACMLPLSSNNNISKELGMRHRAGIGISERTDAVVAIVSEETGDISIAIEGMLKRGLTPETFEKLLRKELMPNDTEKKGILRTAKEKVIPKSDKK